MNNEFEYGDSIDLGNGKHRQTIIYRNQEVGYLISKEKNWLSPIEETYVIPDVKYGMDAPTEGILKGKLGWIDFEVFNDYDDALKYVNENYDEIVYLFKFGDYD